MHPCRLQRLGRTQSVAAVPDLFIRSTASTAASPLRRLGVPVLYRSGSRLSTFALVNTTGIAAAAFTLAKSPHNGYVRYGQLKTNGCELHDRPQLLDANSPSGSQRAEASCAMHTGDTSADSTWLSMDVMKSCLQQLRPIVTAGHPNKRERQMREVIPCQVATSFFGGKCDDRLSRLFD
jgi:hypothetical protein